MDTAVLADAEGPAAPSVADGLAQIAAGLDAAFAAELTPADDDSAHVLLAAIEAQGRRMDALRVAMVDGIERSGTHRLDGHKTAKVMCRHIGRLDEAEARRRAQAAKALRHMPLLAAAFREGRVSAAQVAVVARAFANPRICSRVVEMDAEFTARATDPTVDFREFDRGVRAWVDLVDEDGTVDRFQRQHRNRDLRLDQDFDSSWHLSGGCAANDGVELKRIFDRFCDEQFEADWAEATARLGRNDISVSDLARTPGQRRFDAMMEMARRAASTLPGQSGSQVVTNIVMDVATFEHHVAAYAADNCDHTAGAYPSPGTGDCAPDGRRCETLDGQPVDAATAIATALVGHVRRIVVDERSVVVDASRKRRLFRDAAALAARMSSTVCYWPGCWVPVTACQIDHLIPFNDHGGPTDQENSGPCCGWHNRFRTGYRTERLADGTLAVSRPDGTRIV